MPRFAVGLVELVDDPGVERVEERAVFLRSVEVEDLRELSLVDFRHSPPFLDSRHRTRCGLSSTIRRCWDVIVSVYPRAFEESTTFTPRKSLIRVLIMLAVA
jgi:hypothetical protein